MTAPILATQDITFGYRYDKLALQQVTLSVPAGARVAFVGPNGAGKSTLFLHLNAILKPLSGQLSFKGVPYRYDRSFISELRQKVGLVFQDHDSQIFAGTVLDDVIFGPMNTGLTLKEAEAAARQALEAVHMLEHSNDPVHFLSHGQKKRVAIAGVLSMNPDILVMDEPTAGLDYPGIVNLSGIMDSLHKAGKTLVVATHDIDWAWAWADLVYVLAQGKIIAGGLPETILNSVENKIERGFNNAILGEVGSALASKGFLRSGDRPRTPQELIELLKL